MTLPVNQIGPFQFVTLEGVPVLPYRHAELIERPGVNGSGFLSTGIRGDEFELTSGVDVVSWAAALAAENAYRQICNDSIWDVIKGGMAYSSLSIGFVVRSVIVTEKKRIALSVGGLYAGSAYVRAKWRLHAVPL